MDIPQSQSVTVVKYGTANIGSLVNMLSYLGYRVKVTAEFREIEQSGRLILPGVGKFDAGISELRANGLCDAIANHALGKKLPLLGICLGAQLLLRGSEEGMLGGLSIVPGECRRLKVLADRRALVPHIGWASVRPTGELGVRAPDGGDPKFYFVHSYGIVLDDPRLVTGTVNHGVDIYAACYNLENVVGAQFHPEKSHRFGMMFLSDFMEL